VVVICGPTRYQLDHEGTLWYKATCGIFIDLDSGNECHGPIDIRYLCITVGILFSLQHRVLAISFLECSGSLPNGGDVLNFHIIGPFYEFNGHIIQACCTSHFHFRVQFFIVRSSTPISTNSLLFKCFTAFRRNFLLRPQ